MTRRHLERRFQHDVGLTPKRLARITRFNTLGVCLR
jgi:methylphosphotriester-DNA--protein-cysteine methyltransferase